MKKSINIGIILLFLLQACSSQENTKNQTTLDKIPEDTPINSPQVSENSVENEIIENEVEEEDFKKYHNLDVNELDGIAIMSDTDNSKQKSITYYQNIYFSSQ